MYFYLDTPDKKLSAIKLRYYVKSEKKKTRLFNWNFYKSYKLE